MKLNSMTNQCSVACVSSRDFVVGMGKGPAGCCGQTLVELGGRARQALLGYWSGR